MKYLPFISLFLSAHALFAVTPHAYVTNQMGNSVNVIDTSNDTVQTIYGFTNPRVVQLTPDGALAFVGSDDNTVRIIDTATHTVLPTVISVVHPVALAMPVHPEFLYVLSSDNTVSVIRLSDYTLARLISGFDNPQDLQISPDQSRIYVTNSGNGTVSVISTETHMIVHTITGFKSPVGLTFTIDGKFAYVTDKNNNALYVVSVSKNMITDVILGFNFPSYSAITPDKTYLFVSNSGNNTVNIVRVQDNFVLSEPISIPQPNSIAVTEDGAFLYVGSALGTVFKISLSDHSIKAAITGFDNPSNISVTSNNAPANKVNGCQVAVNPTNIYNQVTWSSGPGTPVGYKIYEDISLTHLVASVSADTRMYKDTHLEKGQSYSYYVLAEYDNGFSSTIGSVTVSPNRLCP